MFQHKPCHTRNFGIKQLIILLSFFLALLQPVSLFAGNTALREDIKQLKAQQTQLDNKLQQFSLVGNSVISKNQSLSEQVQWFMWITFVLAAMLLGLIWFILSFNRKYKTTLNKLLQSSAKESENKQFQTNQIANLQQAIGEQREQLQALKKELELDKQRSQKEFNLLQDKFEYYQQRENIAEEQLEALLNHPVDYTLSSSEKDTLHTLIKENNLSFSSNLKARALEEEYSEAWQRAIDYWKTYIIDQGNDTEALLHIGYANYCLAISNSKDDYYINQAMNAFEKIMLAAPDYFDDMQGYDGEETLNEANNINEDGKEYNLYQQLETYLMKLDELRNYHSIYMLACNYANDGKVQDAQNCLEQIPPIFHAPHCKQLQKDSNLSVLRQFDWFNKLIDEACKAEEAL